MTRDEYLAVLATEPATANQRGRIMAECDRLGLTDRAERLAVLAELLDIDELDTTAELVMGQAGYLVHLLQRTSGRAELPGIAAAAADVDDQGGEQPAAESLTIAGLLMQIAVALWRIFGTPAEPAKTDDPGIVPGESNADD